MSAKLRYAEYPQAFDPQLGCEAIETLSIVTAGDVSTINDILSRSCYYELPNSTQLQSLISLSAKWASDIAGISFSVHASEGSSSVVIDSTSPTSIEIILGEQDYSRNNYIQRYMTFKKKFPPRKSADTSTLYSIKLDLAKPVENRDRDLKALIDNVFATSTIKICSDKEIPSLTEFKKHTELKQASVSPSADLRPLFYDDIKDPHDFYEYLGLLHMNRAPVIDPSEYVRVTSMYKIPEGEIIGEKGGSLSLVFVDKIHPSTLGVLLQESAVKSVLYKRSSSSGLFYKTSTKYHAWEVSEYH